jgi:hypothetical protein
MTMSNENRRTVLTAGLVTACVSIVLAVGISIGKVQAQEVRLERVEVKCERITDDLAQIKAALARIEQKVDDLKGARP